ncbi:hypothetical protein HDV01_000384 [Terramyces sp. JEL0728]|nr:hypothetical protein HDV01_000384 [Terramyces sp. JEL0728]
MIVPKIVANLGPITSFPSQVNVEKPQFTPEQTSLIDQLSTQAPQLAQSDLEREWLDRGCLTRYLKATKWDLPKSIERLEKTLEWRREYKPDEITAENVEEEAITGKQIISGFDKCGRPILYLIPARENTKTYDRQLRYTVYNLEKVIKMMPEGVETFCILVDYQDLSVMTAPPLSVSKKFLEIFGNHYPERMHISFIVNPSWYIWVFFKLIKPFIDPVTAAKLHFVGQNQSKKEDGMGGYVELTDYIDEHMLLKNYGGTHDWDWDFEYYWIAKMKQRKNYNPCSKSKLMYSNLPETQSEMRWRIAMLQLPEIPQASEMRYTLQQRKVDIQSLFADEIVVPDTLVVSNQFEFGSPFSSNTAYGYQSPSKQNAVVNQNVPVQPGFMDSPPAFPPASIDPFHYFNDPEIYSHLLSLSTFVHFPFSVFNGNLHLTKLEEATLIYKKAIICNSIFFSIHPKLFPSVLLGIPPSFQDKVNLSCLIYMDSSLIKPKEEYKSDHEMIEDFKGMFTYSNSLFGVGFPDRSLSLFQETYILAMRYRLFNPNDTRSENLTIDDLAKMVEFVDLQVNVVTPDEWDNRLILYNLCLSSDTYISMISGVQFIVDDTLFDHYLEKSEPSSFMSIPRRDFPNITVPNDYAHAENTIWQGTENAATYEVIKHSFKLLEYVNAREFCKSGIYRTKVYRRIITYSRSKSKSAETKAELLKDLDKHFKLEMFEPEFADLANFIAGELDIQNKKTKFPHSFIIPLSNLIMYCYLNQHEVEDQEIKPQGPKYPIKTIFTAIFNYLITIIESAKEGDGVNPHLQPPTIIFLVYCISSSCLVKAGSNEMKEKIVGKVLPVLDNGSSVWELCRTYATQMRRLLQIINF